VRERRWETTTPLTFGQVLVVGERLAALGLKPAVPAKDVICYVEEWTVESPEDFDQLDAWSTEDVTLIHVREGWRGDFFLLAGAYHTVYQRYQDVGTYCSISHPWRIRDPLRLHDPRSMLWLGFRHAHSFIRVRLQTKDVITPGRPAAMPSGRSGWRNGARRFSKRSRSWSFLSKHWLRNSNWSCVRRSFRALLLFLARRLRALPV
jgi:hypothetical protein